MQDELKLLSIPKIQLLTLSSTLKNLSTQLTTISENLQQQITNICTDAEKELLKISEDLATLIDSFLLNIKDRTNAFYDEITQTFKNLVSKTQETLDKEINKILSELSQKNQEYLLAVNDIEKNINELSTRIFSAISSVINIFRGKLQNFHANLNYSIENFIDAFREKSEDIINYAALSIRELYENTASSLGKEIDFLCEKIHSDVAKSLEELRKMIRERITSLSLMFSEIKSFLDSTIDSISNTLMQAYKELPETISMQISSFSEKLNSDILVFNEKFTSTIKSLLTEINRVSESIPKSDEILNIILTKLDDILKSKEVKIKTTFDEISKILSKLSTMIPNEMMKFYDTISRIVLNNINMLSRTLKSYAKRIEDRKREFEIISEMIDSKLNMLEEYIKQEVENIITSIGEGVKIFTETSSASTAESTQQSPETTTNSSARNYQIVLTLNSLKHNLTQLLSEISSKISELRQILKSFVLENSGKILESIQNDLTRLSERTTLLPTAQELLEKIKPITSTQINEVSKLLMEYQKALEKSILDVKTTIETSLHKEVSKLLEDIINKLGKIEEIILVSEKNTSELFEEISMRISEYCNKLNENMKTILTEHQKSLASRIEEMKEKIHADINKILTSNRDILDEFLTIFEQKVRQTLDTVINELKTAKKNFYDLFSNLLDNIEKKQEVIKQELEETLKVPQEEISKTIENALLSLSQASENLRNKLITELETQFNSIREFLQKTKDDLQKIIDVSSKYLQEILKSAETTLTQNISELSKSFLETMNGILGETETLINKAKQDLNEKLVNVIQILKKEILKRTQNIVMNLTSSYTKVITTSFITGQKQFMEKAMELINSAKDILLVASEHPEPLLKLLKQVRNNIRIYLISSRDILNELKLETKDIPHIRLRILSNIPITFIFNGHEVMLGTIKDDVIAIKITDEKYVKELTEIAIKLLSYSQKV